MNGLQVWLRVVHAGDPVAPPALIWSVFIHLGLCLEGCLHKMYELKWSDHVFVNETGSVEILGNAVQFHMWICARSTCVTSSPRYQWKLCRVSLLQACSFFLSINLFWPMLLCCCCLFKETRHCFFIENVPLNCRCHGWKHCNCKKGDLTCKYVRI